MMRPAPAPRPRTEPDDDVIILDLDGPMEATGFEGTIGIGRSGPGELVFDLDAMEAAGGSVVEETKVTPTPAARPPNAGRPKPPPAVVDPLASSLDQLDSFIEHDLNEDALRLLGRLEHEHPQHPGVAERRLSLKAKGVLLEEVAAVPTGGPEELFADEEESFIDLAKELEAELAEEEAMVEEATGRGKEEAILEEVFREFQKGVQEQLSEEDSDTHFNLGIAYKEMGLLPEAIREFQVASRDPGLFVECCSIVGRCYM